MEIRKEALHSPPRASRSLDAEPPALDRFSLRRSSERHATAPQHLLSWPCSPIHPSTSELQYPVSLEINPPKLADTMEPPSCLAHCPGGAAWLSELSLAQFRSLAQAYFSHFHPSYMILDESYFYQMHMPNALQSDFAPSTDTCLVLLVLGLGSVSAYDKGHIEWGPSAPEGPPAGEVGLSFLNISKEMFQQVEATTWASVQYLLLTACVLSQNLLTMLC